MGKKASNRIAPVIGPSSQVTESKKFADPQQILCKVTAELVRKGDDQATGEKRERDSVDRGTGQGQDSRGAGALCPQHLPVEKPSSPSDFRTTSEYVLKTVALGLGRPQGSCSTSTDLFRNPLRLILARTPISETIWSGTHETLYFLDTLDCGHQVYVFPQNFLSGKKRHRCLVCGEAQLALKFPRKKAA